MEATTKQIAAIFKVTDRAVQKWGRSGCPGIARGRWYVPDVLTWWLENVYRSDEDGEALAEAKLEYWQAKGRVEKVKADVAEGKAILIDDFKQAWVWRVSEMSNGLGAIPLRLSSLMTGKTEKEIKSILEDEIWKIRDKFSRTGRFTPLPKKKPAYKRADNAKRK